MMRALLAIAWILAAIAAPLAQPMVPGGFGPMQPGGSAAGAQPTPPAPACSQAAAWLARNANLDNPSIINSQNLICGMVSDGDFCGSKFDAIYLFAINNLNSALLNLCGTQFSASRVPGVNFVANEGFSTISGNFSVFVNSNFTPSTAGGNFTLNAAHVSAWTFSGTTDSNTAIATSPPSTFPLTDIYPARPIDGNTYCRINDSNPPSGGTPDTDSTGWFVCNRSGASATQLYKNGSLFGSPNNTASGSLVAIPLVFAIGTSQRIGIGTIGGSLDSATVSRVYARFCAYLIAQRGSCTAPPTVAVTSPTNGTPVTGQLKITATATAPGGIGAPGVTIQVDGVGLVFPVTTPPFGYSWNSASVVDGPHTITATVTDNAGNITTSSAVTITTSNGTTPNTYYFAAAGSDSGNTCLVQASPCLTLAKATSLSYKGGDSILFNGGDAFSGCLVLTTSNAAGISPGYRLTVSNYGTGSPTINSNCTSTGQSGAISVDGISGIVVSNLTIRAGAIMTRAGVYVLNSSSSRMDTVTIENNDIAGFGTYGAGGTFFGGEVMIDDSAGTAGLANVSLLNNNLHGLSGPTSTDDNGAAGFASVPPNIRGLIAQGNIIYDIGGTSRGGAGGSVGNGMIFNGVNNGVHRYDLAHDLGANTNTCGGPAGLWWGTGGARSATRFSEVYRVQHVGTFPATACDFDCYDWDNGTSGGLGEYLYCHDSDGPAFLAFVSNNITYRYSISENTNNLGVDAAAAISTIGRADFYNLTIWLSFPATTGRRPAAFEFDFGSSTANLGVAANNIFAVRANDLGNVPFVEANYTGETPAGPTGYNFANNDYYNMSGSGTLRWKPGSTIYTSLAAWQASSSGRDPNATIANPLVTGGGSGGICTWTPSTQSPTWPPNGCPTAYTLQGGSTIKSTGIDLTQAPYSLTIGARDYYANTIPGSGNCFNIGASGACP